MVSSARFAPDGTIVAVDQSAKRVLILDSDLDIVRDVGRAGPGPGEYDDPVAAVMDDQGRIFVADGAGGVTTVIVYDPDGSFVRQDQLPLYLSPRALATDGQLVYVAGQALFFTDPPPDNRPLLAAYDPTTGETQVMLEQDPDWFGEPPVYRNSFVNLIPRVDALGNICVGFVEGYEIWKITGPNEYDVILRGCVPEGALAVYEADDDDLLMGQGSSSFPPGLDLNFRPPRPSYQILSDFAVLSDGYIVTRSVLYVDEAGKRSMELFSGEGTLERAWSLGPGRLLTGWGVMDGNDPSRQFSWNANNGTSVLGQFPFIDAEAEADPDAAPSRERGGSDGRGRVIGLWISVLLGALVILVAAGGALHRRRRL